MKRYLIIFSILGVIIYKVPFAHAEVIFDTTYTTNTSTAYSSSGNNYTGFLAGQEPINMATTTLYYEYYISSINSSQVNSMVAVNSNSNMSSVPGRTYAVGLTGTSSTVPILATGTISITLNTSDYFWVFTASQGAGSNYGSLYGNSGGSYTNDPNDSGQAHINGASVWFCMTTLANYSDCGIPPFTPPSLSFVFPKQGTTIPDFNNYVFSTQSLTSTDQYYISVNTNALPIFQATTQSITETGGQMLNYGTPVTNPYFNAVIPQTTTTIYVNATLYDITNFEVPDNINNFIIATTSISYTRILNGGSGTSSYYLVLPVGNASSGFSVSTSTILNPNIANIQTNATTSQYCNNLENTSTSLFGIGSDLLWAGCQLVNYSFNPTPNYTVAIQQSLNNFQNIFPFNLYFAVVGGVQSDLNTSNVPTSTTLSLGIQGLNGQEINMITISSSTTVNALTNPTTTTIFGFTQGCNNTCATEAVNNLYLPFKMGIWIITGIKIVGLITTI